MIAIAKQPEQPRRRRIVYVIESTPSMTRIVVVHCAAMTIKSYTGVWEPPRDDCELIEFESAYKEPGVDVEYIPVEPRCQRVADGETTVAANLPSYKPPQRASGYG